MDDPLYRLRRDREWDKFMSQDIVMIAPLERCEAEAKRLRDHNPYNVTDYTGMIVSQWYMGECTWARTTDSAGDRRNETA